MANESAFSPSPPAPPPLAAADVAADALLAPWPVSPWPAPHVSRPNPLFAILPLSALAIGLVLLVAVAVILVLTRRGRLRMMGAGVSVDGDKPGAPASSCASSARGSHNGGCYAAAGCIYGGRLGPLGLAVVQPRRSQGAQVFTYRELERATDGFSEVNVLGRGAYGVVFRGRLGDGTPAAIKRLQLDLRRQGEREFRVEVGPPEPDALAAPGGAAGVLRGPEPPAAGVRVHAQRHPQEPPAPRRRHGGGCEDAAAAPGRAGLADASVYRAGLRPRAGVPARAHLPGGHPPRLQLQQRPPRPQLPRPRLRLRHRQGRLQQGQRPGPDPRPRHHRLPRARVRVDGEADDQVGRVQLRGGAPRAADRPGAGGHAAAAGTARPRLMGSSPADQPREARADGGPGPERPVQRERSRPGCRHRGDVRADQGGVPAADDGRGAVADPHREEEPRHVLLLHAGEAPAARRLHEPAAEAGVTRWQGALERGAYTYDGMEFKASCTYPHTVRRLE